MNSYEIRISKSGKIMSTATSETGQLVWETLAELQNEATAFNALFDAHQAQVRANAKATEMNNILADNDLVSSEVGAFLQNGGNIDLDRKSWQTKAVEHAVASRSNFKLYRHAQALYDGVASWTLDKEFAKTPNAFAADAGNCPVFEKTVRVGDKMTFIGNQNSYAQFEVIA